MPNAFSITTPPSGTLLLGEDRRADVSFTVTNQTGRNLRATARLVALAGADAAWLGHADEPSRDFIAGESEQYLVRVAVPPEVPGGVARFRIDVVGVERPDDDWAQGPEVSFEIPAGPPPPEPLPEEPPGYVETVIGALLGAVAGAIVGALIGVAIVIVISAVGEFPDLGSVIGAFIIAVILILALAGIGLVVGSALGAYLSLRLRHFPKPSRTALPVGIVVPLIGVPLGLALGAVSNALEAGGGDLPGPVAFIVLLLAVLVPVIGGALGGRAFYRFRTVKHL
jgi:hypothetical protein